MATYASILSKVEDAAAYAYTAIPDAADVISGVTTFKGAQFTEISLPAVVFYADKADKIEGDDGPDVHQNFMVSINIEARTQGDDSGRIAHVALEGLLEAIYFRSANQIVTQCNAAGLSDFTALAWFPLGIERDYDGATSTTTLNGLLLCASSGLS